VTVFHCWAACKTHSQGTEISYWQGRLTDNRYCKYIRFGEQKKDKRKLSLGIIRALQNRNISVQSQPRSYYTQFLENTDNSMFQH